MINLDVTPALHTRKKSSEYGPSCHIYVYSVNRVLAYECKILIRSTTFDLDRRYAMDFKDTRLLAKLASGDMFAIGAKYHGTCLASLNNGHSVVCLHQTEQFQGIKSRVFFCRMYSLFIIYQKTRQYTSI